MRASIEGLGRKREVSEQKFVAVLLRLRNACCAPKGYEGDAS